MEQHPRPSDPLQIPEEFDHPKKRTLTSVWYFLILEKGHLRRERSIIIQPDFVNIIDGLEENGGGRKEKWGDG
jgi:hypothetical protein